MICTQARNKDISNSALCSVLCGMSKELSNILYTMGLAYGSRTANAMAYGVSERLISTNVWITPRTL